MKHRISDHAVVRYLERIQGVDIEAVRGEIAALCAHAFETGACAMVLAGHRYMIAPDGTVVTVEPIGYSRARRAHLSQRQSRQEELV